MDLINPRSDAVIGVNVSFWAARMFTYTWFGILGGGLVTVLPALALMALDTAVTFHTSMKIIQGMKIEEIFSTP